MSQKEHNTIGSEQSPAQSSSTVHIIKDDVVLDNSQELSPHHNEEDTQEQTQVPTSTILI